MNTYSPSLFDKLTRWSGDERSLSLVPQLSLDEVKDSVARDLESLLNTRYVLDEAGFAAFPECRQSVWTYGLCDFAGMSLASIDDRAVICRSLEQGIVRHEPRLKHVKALLEPSKGCINSLRFSISAMLVVQESREPVSFDAVLQPSTLKYSISRSKHNHQGRI